MIISFLKYINSLPFSLTIKHYQTFGKMAHLLKDNELNSMESWDALRITHPQFSISKNREEWLLACDAQVKKDGQDGGLLQRAHDVSKLLKEKKLNSIFSVGVGGAGLEYQIKKNSPEMKIVCSEFAPENVSLLKNVFIEADEIIRFDLLRGDWAEIKQKYLSESSVCLMYRVDASFSDSQWREIFLNLHKTKIKNIIFIPSSFLTLRSIYNRKSRELKWFLLQKPVAFSGFLRTKKTFESYWDGLYNEELYEFGGIKGFFLSIR